MRKWVRLNTVVICVEYVMSVETDTHDIESFVRNHPRLLGALFMVLLLVSQAGSAAAGAIAYPGP